MIFSWSSVIKKTNCLHEKIQDATRKLTKKQGKADQIRGTVNNNYYIGGRLYIMGSWATDSINFTKDLGTRISEATGEKRG